jgi:outer membrane protein TolC
MAAMLTMAACASVGPDYVPPEPEAPDAWNAPLENGLKQDPMDLRALAAWWAVFNDPALSALMREAVSGNLDLKHAESKIREARARRRIERAALFPMADATGDFNKIRSSENAGAGLNRDLYQAGFDAAW